MRYMILTYYRQANGKIDEVMAVAKRVKDRDWQSANIILDFKEQQVLKCSIEGNTIPKDWETVVGYYYEYYKNIMERLFAENGHVLPTEEVNEQLTTS